MKKETIINNIERIDIILDKLSIVTDISKVTILNQIRNDLVNELNRNEE